MINKIYPLYLSLRVGIFVAWREIFRTKIIISFSFIFVLILAVLNLILVDGILLGLVEGVSKTTRKFYTGDVLLITPRNKTSIVDTTYILYVLEKVLGVEQVSPRYISFGIVENLGSEELKKNDLTTQIIGINPDKENEVNHLSEAIIEGEYLNSGDTNSLLLGANLVDTYNSLDSPALRYLEDIKIGSWVTLTLGYRKKNMMVKGIIKSKVAEADHRVYILDSEFKSLLRADVLNAQEISVKLDPETSPQLLTQILKGNNIHTKATILTYREAQSQIIADTRKTFVLLGDILGAISLFVATVTVFIIIFTNAISQRREIGILKGLGISALAIKSAFILQAVFYVLIASFVSLVFVYVAIEPYVIRHPFNFPFSDGLLYVPIERSVLKVGIIIATTIIAGYLPAHLIVNKSTMEAISGEKRI